MKNAWAGTKVLILGLGQYPKGSGISAALFAARQGAEVLATDLKQEHEIADNVARLKKFKNVRFRLGEHKLEDIDWADIVIRNPRVRRTSPEMMRATKLGKRVESDVSLFMQLCPAKVVGITGTRGKSTTTTLVHDMLKRSGKTVWLGGNILISPLTFVEKVKPRDIVVLELSSWLLETTGAVGISPQVGCITNLMRDHLNSYEHMDEYGEAKAQVFRHQDARGYVVLNGDDKFCQQCAKEAPGEVALFTPEKQKGSDAWIEGDALMMKDGASEQKLANISSLKVAGTHMYANMLAAALTARAAGASLAGIKKSLAAFAGLKDRQEIVAVKGGITFVNDTTASTPDGVMACIEVFAPRANTIRVILGGNDKDLEYTALAKHLKRTSADVALVPGTSHAKLATALKSAKVSYIDVSGMLEGFKVLAARAEKGDAVILSPGATSFGEFKNEFERGERFRALVRNFKPKASKG